MRINIQTHAVSSAPGHSDLNPNSRTNPLDESKTRRWQRQPLPALAWLRTQSGAPAARSDFIRPQNTQTSCDITWLNSTPEQKHAQGEEFWGSALPSFTSDQIQLEAQLVPPSTPRMEEENEEQWQRE